MRNLVICALFCGLFFFASIALAESNDHYVTQVGAGSRNGVTPDNAWAVSDFNKLKGTDYAGDTFYFSGTFTTRIEVYISGTSGNPVTLDGYQGGNCAPLNSECISATLLKYGMAVGNGVSGPDYLDIQDFRMTRQGSTQACFSFYGKIGGTDDQKHIDHINIKRNYVYETTGTMFYYYPGRHVVVEGNKFVHFGQNGNDAVQGVNIIAVQYALFRGNEFGHNENSHPSGCKSANVVEIHGGFNQLWEYNDIYGAPNQAGVAPKEWGDMEDMIFRFNKIHNNAETGLNIGGGADNLRQFYVYGNNFYGNGYTGGASYDNADYTYWWSNIFHDNGRHGFLTWTRGQGEPDNVWILNNTFSRNGGSGTDPNQLGRGGVVLSAGSNFTIKNNVFYNNRETGALGYYHQFLARIGVSELENNTHFHSSGPVKWYYGKALRDHVYMKDIGKETYSEISDPGFTDSDGADNINGTADDDYSLNGSNVDNGETLSECYPVVINAGDYTTVTLCLNEALDPRGTDWTTTPPTVQTAKQGEYGPWERGAFVFFEDQSKEFISAPKGVTVSSLGTP